MKYVINPDLAWQRASYLVKMNTFVCHMVCAGHPHIKTCCTQFEISVTLFMEPEDDVNDIIEVANRYLDLFWTRSENHVENEDGLTRWITFEYRYNR